VLATQRRGFTLIEMLVVIGILGILTAISIPAISAVRRRSQVSATDGFLQRLGLAIEQYQSDFGDFPPSRFRKLRLGTSNGQNEGVECLVRCLLTAAKKGPYIEFEEKDLGNTDDDKAVAGANPTRALQQGPELREAIDSWGNPIVYLHNADYDRGGTAFLGEKGLAKVTASKGETGQYDGLTTFQLWSAGPDGDAGTDDDLRFRGE
jgi:prepilin-type N-terminal cleavage/methylation domain-containing protein